MNTNPTFAERFGPYDEVEMIGYTVLRYRGDLLTPFERDCAMAFFAKAKGTVYGNPEVEARIRKQAQIAPDAQADAVVSGGYPAFRRTVGSRVQAERMADLEPNRCPQCAKIVLTPWAEWCMWCRHDWHPK